VVFTDNTVLGDGVNIASRLNAIASPGGVCISERVYDDIRNKPEFQVKDLGEKKLKNVARPIHVYALTSGVPGQYPLSPWGPRFLVPGFVERSPCQRLLGAS
jgi:adenylate cyclase